MKIIVGFSRSSSPLSAVIRCLTGSKVSHVYVREVDPRFQEDLIVQASGLTVNVESISHFLSHTSVVEEFAIDVDIAKWLTGENFKRSSLGKPYGWLQLAGYGYTLVCKRFGWKVRNPLADGDHSYVCVEWVAKYLGMDQTEVMTPEDLLEILVALQSRSGCLVR